RLAREQLVDAEVVRITAARQPYIDALLTVAGAQSAVDLAPASSFFQRRHLLRRMHLLLTEVSMSKIRLFGSYASMAAILAFTGWFVFLSFPITGQAEVRRPVQQEQQRPQQTAPGYVVNRAPITYPSEAIQKRIEGTVVVDLTFND